MSIFNKLINWLFPKTIEIISVYEVPRRVYKREDHCCPVLILETEIDGTVLAVRREFDGKEFRVNDQISGFNIKGRPGDKVGHASYMVRGTTAYVISVEFL